MHASVRAWARARERKAWSPAGSGPVGSMVFRLLLSSISLADRAAELALAGDCKLKAPYNCFAFRVNPPLSFPLQSTRYRSPSLSLRGLLAPSLPLV